MSYIKGSNHKNDSLCLSGNKGGQKQWNGIFEVLEEEKNLSTKMPISNENILQK